ncbi:MAG: hypothetical protein J7M29_04100, partial [Verrucomicrobia bacterium]|nr:hypothetical protein [Verrucomicrobiota bacterium]
MRRWIFPAIAGAAVLASVARLPFLSERPMHTDEAVQGVKFLQLWEHGQYRYDPNEYHGPALNYLTLPTAKLAAG